MSPEPPGPRAQEALGTRMRWGFTTLETWGKLARVNVCHGFWECYQRQGKIDQKLTGASPVTIAEKVAGHVSAPVPLTFQKWWMCSWQMRWTKRFLFYCEIYWQVALNQSLSNFRPLGWDKGLTAINNSIFSYLIFNSTSLELLLFHSQENRVIDY